MAINEAMRRALKALSYMDADVKKTYSLRRSVSNLRAKLHVRSPAYHMWDHTVEQDGRAIPVRVFLPSDKERVPGTLLFFHGGGWVTGNIDTYTRVCADMAKMTHRAVVSVDYRLAPEHPFPAGLHDCYAVTKELLNSPPLDAFSGDVTLIGDSAGANLAAAVSLMLRDEGEVLPKRQILIYPATYPDHGIASPYESVRTNGYDYLLTSKKIREYMDLYKTSDDDLKNPYFAPLLASDFADQPDTLIITAEYDPLRDEGEDYGRKLRAAGAHVLIYRMEDALHGFFSLPTKFSHVTLSYLCINRFLREDPS